MNLYANQFSPFARKVMLALNFKKLAYDSVDGLAKDHHEELWRVNPRGEVPTLQDGDTVVSQSARLVCGNEKSATILGRCKTHSRLLEVFVQFIQPRKTQDCLARGSYRMDFVARLP